MSDVTYTLPDGTVLNLESKSYRDHEQNQQLNAVICERLGWKDIRRRNTYTTTYRFWSGIPPENALQGSIYAGELDGFHDGDIGELPDYVGDMDAAMQLFNQLPLDTRVGLVGDLTAPHICLAWLADTEEKDGQS